MFLLLFLPYLWGIETNLSLECLMFLLLFLPYLWGIETRYRQKVNKKRVAFLPYLWGIETVILELFFCYFTENFYPTYEALKPKKIIFFLFHRPIIFTLPMRHWNILVEFVLIIYLTKFLPYLWGIETRIIKKLESLEEMNFYPTYEALKRFFVI